MKPDRMGRGGWPAMVVWPLMAVSLAVLTGCPPPQPREQERLTRSATVEQYNTRAVAITKLWARCHVEARIPKVDREGRRIAGQYETLSVDGNFIFRKPRDLYFVGKAFTDPMFGLQSNKDLYWFWIKPQVAGEWFGRYDGPGARTFDLRPDYLLETLAIFPIVDDMWVLRRNEDTDVLQIMNIEMASAQMADQAKVQLTLREEITLNREPKLHDPIEVRLYDREGEPVVISRLDEYQVVDGQRVPMKLVYTFKQRDARFTLWLKDVSLTQEVKDAAFEFRPEPWLKGPPVDLDKTPEAEKK